jgi:hypothetical protein
MKKLSEKWRLYELFCQQHYLYKCLEGKELKIQNEIIKLSLEILNKKILLKDFNALGEELKIFAHKYSYHFVHNKNNDSTRYALMLGPVGKVALYNSGYRLNLEDIAEVHINTENWSGCFNSKTCGWVSWKIVKGDYSIIKSLSSALVFLISKNNHNMHSAIDNLEKKFARYVKESMSRNFKRFFINNHFWFHDDLKDLYNELPITRERNDQMLRLVLEYENQYN